MNKYAIVAAIRKWPCGEEVLVAGYFNSDLAAPEGNTRDKEIAEDLAMTGPKDTIDHFLPRSKTWLRDGQTWSMIHMGWEVRSRTDYILGTDHRLLQNVVVQDVRHNKNHYLVLGCLHGAAPEHNSCYLRKRKRFPLDPPKTLGGFYPLFVELRVATTNPPCRERLQQVWISPKTWRPINTRVEAHRIQDGKH